MKTTKTAAVAVWFALFGAIACGGEAASGKPAVDDGVAAQLESGEAFCLGQKAWLPASGKLTQTVAATRAEAIRTDSFDNVYISYRVQREGLFLYLSFAPGLPASFTTTEARAAFRYAYVDYALEQPPAVGSKLAFLTSSDLLTLSDFERLDVNDGLMSFRLARTNMGHYSKRLSVADLDPSVDPSLCTIGDISGGCWCEFSGPATAITLDGTFPI